MEPNHPAGKIMGNIKETIAKNVATPPVKTGDATKDLINKLENDGNKSVQQMYSSNMGNTVDIMQNTFVNANKEFEKKLGRPMTYAEMRMMYG